MANTKNRQISVRIPAELDEWLQSKAVKGHGKADVVRSLIENARTQEAEHALRAMFDEAARELTEEDRQERELWFSAWAGHAEHADPGDDTSEESLATHRGER